MKFLKRTAYHLFPSFRPKTNIESLHQKKTQSDIFFVNGDGSISLNHNSDIVKKAFSENIERLRKVDAQE